jgi:hypothetical protein
MSIIYDFEIKVTIGLSWISAYHEIEKDKTIRLSWIKGRRCGLSKSQASTLALSNYSHYSMPELNNNSNNNNNSRKCKAKSHISKKRNYIPVQTAEQTQKFKGLFVSLFNTRIKSVNQLNTSNLYRPFKNKLTDSASKQSCFHQLISLISFLSYVMLYYCIITQLPWYQDMEFIALFGNVILPLIDTTRRMKCIIQANLDEHNMSVNSMNLSNSISSIRICDQSEIIGPSFQPSDQATLPWISSSTSISSNQPIDTLTSQPIDMTLLTAVKTTKWPTVVTRPHSLRSAAQTSAISAMPWWLPQPSIDINWEDKIAYMIICHSLNYAQYKAMLYIDNGGIINPRKLISRSWEQFICNQLEHSINERGQSAYPEFFYEDDLGKIQRYHVKRLFSVLDWNIQTGSNSPWPILKRLFPIVNSQSSLESKDVYMASDRQYERKRVEAVRTLTRKQYQATHANLDAYTVRRGGAVIWQQNNRAKNTKQRSINRKVSLLVQL